MKCGTSDTHALVTKIKVKKNSLTYVTSEMEVLIKTLEPKQMQDRMQIFIAGL